ncbi:sulfurtransferase TusA family protein [Bacilliculturomica massiliensis]|uniref:sulfurtransferase TusA family protein n=1 Tax=Bacilliculturomica massiliensis TaxID=1917867 RepID=UPI0010307706|nr:sulfurtransferase TusA family protein [Bacilliculturomica massiliensis]
MEKIDCLGEFCPIPIMRLQKAVPKILGGEPMVLVTDHSCTVAAVRDFCGRNHLTYTADEVINGVWEITVSK